MAKKDINRSVKITLDHSDMTSKYKDLSTRSDQLQASLAKLNAEGKGNTREAQALQKQYDSTTKEMEKHNAKVEQTRSVLNNLSGSTYKELLAVKKQLQNELKEETRGTEAFAAKSEQLTRVQEELTTVQGEMKSVSSSLINELSSAPGVVGTLTKSFQGLISACKAFIANPVGLTIAAIAGAVALCVKGFKDFAGASEEGGMKAAKSLAPIKVIGTEIGKLFKYIGGYVVDMVGGLTNMVYKAVGWLAPFNDKAKEIHENMTRQYAIEEKSYELGKQKQQMIEKEAEMNRDLAELKLKMRQTDKYSADERKAFLEEYLSKENDLSKLKMDQAKQERELWEMESAQDDNDYEANKRGAELNASIYQSEMEYSDRIASIQKRRLSLQKELNGETEVTLQKVNDTKDREIEAVDAVLTREKALIEQQHQSGQIAKGEYLKSLEDLEMDALRRKFEIYELDAAKRKAIEDEIYAYKEKMFGTSITQAISPEIKQAKNIEDKKIEIAKKGSADLNKIAQENLKKQQNVFAEQQELSEAYKGIATGAASAFGGIMGEFIGSSERSAEEMQYNMLILSLNTLQQMVLLWSAELFGNMTAKYGPIAGPALAAAGTALIQGIFTGVKNSIKKPSSKEVQSEESSSGSRAGSITVRDTGYASGGYTGNGGVLEPAGIVHKGEYVIPAWQMQMPETMDMVRVLESTRISGGKSIPDVGYASGGAVTSGAMESDLLSKIYSLLQYIAGNPVPAYVLLSEFEKQKLRRDTAKQYGTK